MINDCTLGKLINWVNDFEQDIDVDVDGTDFGIALCHGTELTEEGKKHFAKALELPIREKWLVECDDSEEYDKYDNGEESAVGLAVELLEGLAGYISQHEYDLYFKEIE